MGPVTQILNAIEQGDPTASEKLLPLVYDELRQLAASKLSQEKPGQTLQATALVHEAYLRLVADNPLQQWNSRGHFFAAAAEAMRRILVEQARRKRLTMKVDLETADVPAETERETELIELSDSLEALAREEPVAAKVAQMRLFAGLTVEDAGSVLGLSRASAYREWTFARAWLANSLSEKSPDSDNF